MKKKVFLLVAILVSLTLSSCSIYEEGPGISFNSRKQRAIGDWQVDVAFDTETEKDVTEDFVNVSYSLLGDGTLSRYTYVKSLDSTLVTYGLWDLVDSDKQLRLLFTDPPTWPDRDFWTIRRLTEKDLWVYNTIDSATDTTQYEIRFMPGKAATNPF
ncbi:MAG: hypothetical protein H6581_22405 [Bacteroidia bacterium]|nr:hypothetical protein [Bacteroidia bacterium]